MTTFNTTCEKLAAAKRRLDAARADHTGASRRVRETADELRAAQEAYSLARDNFEDGFQP